MRILFVASADHSSGEAITAFHVASAAVEGGDEVRLLASGFTARFCPARLMPFVEQLSGDPGNDWAAWDQAVRSFRPQAVVFADYPLCSLAWLSAAGRDWAHEADALDAELFALDHLGYSQGPRRLHFGPPHLSLPGLTTPALPRRAQLVLPCPIQEPADVPGRRGRPVRYRRLPLRISDNARRAVRRRFLADEADHLVFHSVPTWSRELAKRFELPYFEGLSRLFTIWFSGLARPVTIISVNGGALLPRSEDPDVRICNLAEVGPGEYEELLLASDLMITENGISVSLGLAACGLVPCAVLQNSYSLQHLAEHATGEVRRLVLEMESRRPGAIFPCEVFPIWRPEDVEALGVLRGNTLRTACQIVEVYGGEPTRTALCDLLTNNDQRSSLQARQWRYVGRVAGLIPAAEVISGSLVSVGRPA